MKVKNKRVDRELPLYNMRIGVRLGLIL